MAQTNSGNYDALALVQDEAQQSLEDALQALTQFIDNPTNNSALEQCITYLHQINGLVEMLSLQGAYLLSKEMLTSAVATRGISASKLVDIQDSLLKGLLILPNYLKLLGIELEDHPLRLITTINELRSARGDDAIDDQSLFKPILSIQLPEIIAPIPNQETPKINVPHDKISHVFQILLLHWIKNNETSSLTKMVRIIRHLRLSSTQDLSITLWWAAEGIIEAISEDGLSPNPEIKLSLGNLNQPIKVFTQSGEQQFLSLFPVELLKRLLLIVAKATSSGKHVLALKKAFKLDFFDAQQNLKIYSLSNNAFSDANMALLEQLQEIKEQVDQFSRHDVYSLEALQQLSEQFSTMASTLQLLSEESASIILLHNAEQLNTLIGKQQLPNDEQLMSLANDLLQLEDILQQGTTVNQQASQNKELQNIVLNECLNELSNLKENLTLLNEQPQKTAVILSEASSQLALIAGSMTLLNLIDTAKLLENTAKQMSFISSSKQDVTNHELSWFAEIIAAIDMYLSGIRQHGQQQSQLLDSARNLLINFDSLSITIIQSQDNDPITALDDIPTSSATHETGVERYLQQHAKSEASLTSVEKYIQQQNITILTKKSPETSVDRYIKQLSLSNLPQTSVERYIQQQQKLDIENELLTKALPEKEECREPQFSEGIDTEIAEIFIEEANEVLAELTTLIPSWKTLYAPDLTKDIRRYFHTLKGSGRMAGAIVIGDLAWSVEDVLNKITEGEASCSSAVVDLIVSSQQHIPELLSRFTQGDMNRTEQVDTLIHDANNIFNSTETEINFSEDDELQQIFITEAELHLNVFDHNLGGAVSPFVLNSELLRAAHSLKGCANIAQVTPVALVATQLDKTLRHLYEHNHALNEQQLIVLIETIDGIKQILRSPESNEPDIRLLVENIEQLVPKNSSDKESQEKRIDPEFLLVFLEETDELLNQYSQQLSQLQQQSDNASYQKNIEKTLSILSESAQDARLVSLVELYKLFTSLIQYEKNETSFNLLEHGLEEVNNQIESLIQNKPAPDLDDFKQHVENFLSQPIDNPELKVSVVTTTSNHFIVPDIDADLLEAFTEECAELLESSGSTIKQWQQNNNDQSAIKQLNRDLHTIKGGARLAVVTPIADLTHQIESLISITLNNHELSDKFFNLLQRCQDRLTEMQESLARRSSISFANDLLTEISQFYSQVSEQPVIVEPQIEEVPIPQAAPTHVEQIRVRADLLDFLSNFAGEVNISHDRVSQQNTAIRQQVTEMEATVSRLQEQLRNFEMETEAQILFRYEDTKVDNQSEFDPLELDRFSMMHQLSRGLTESVSDLNDITQSLSTLVSDSDSILLQQSRLSTDLQHGLMNTRLLPFSGLIPRFERIIRQSNSELGKKAELVVYGVDQELDRTILDRIVAPIEHILRNAIAHGIESPDARRILGKDETGKLSLTIARDGSEILITLKDDGQGINIAKVRQKALELNLITTDNIPSDEKLIQLILTSGFSTADNVSQLSGRGVGMDVVVSDIRTLKGRLSIQSVTGQSTTFTIRLPLTLSIMQVLLVSSLEQQYAIPLAAVHASERIMVQDIHALLSQGDEPRYQFNKKYYQFIPLAKLLDQPLNLPVDPKQHLPLLLFSYGDKHIALLVDSINSNREIVLKSVGEQLDHIRSINGATILGDGQVAFVIDIPTLISTTDLIKSNTLQESAENQASTQIHTPLAMVVDDSITMRKASGNLLKRHGFNVITARDGIDAVAQLNEYTPDLILLDVEMPRMDGFEFATIVRNDPQFKDLPIIMITSRTGDKHRDRAKSIGVNDYMGKPYQEIDLIASMKNLLGDKYPSTIN
ncbi:MAG: Hpt domain-containing protein [Piscirickettsiaceae bacterium]|nr:Hpt domain-containing protein [Piscirickettsiaceae bacterium]